GRDQGGFDNPFAVSDGEAPGGFDPNAFGSDSLGQDDDGGGEGATASPFSGFIGAAAGAEAFADFGAESGNAGNFFLDNVLGPAAAGEPSEGGFGAEGEAPEGGLAADGEPGGWQGPTFEREEGGGLKGDFFAPQKAFSLGAPGGADPDAGDGGLGPADPLGEFFGEFLSPEGEPGAAGSDDGPGLAEGVQSFFDPSQEGGFDPNDFFDNARGSSMGPADGMDGQVGEAVEGSDRGGPAGGMVPGLAFDDEGVRQFQPPVAFDMGEGGQAMAWEDGMSQVRQDDGSTNIFWGDGKSLEREVGEDGGFRQSNPDGTEIIENADGTGQFTSINGDLSVREAIDGGGFVTTREDGGLMFENADGGTSRFEPSGWSREQVVDPESGAVMTRGSDGLVEVVNTDGTFNRVNPDGSQDQAFFNEEGGLQTEYGDGSQHVVNADGSEDFQDATGYGGKTVQADDGSYVTLMTDGASTMEAEDGSWAIEVAPNGEQTVTSTLDDGTVQTNMADGGVQRYNPEIGATTYTSPEGGDYVTRENPDGSVVVTDPGGMVTESDPVTGRTDITFADGSTQTTERLENGSLATVMATGETLVTAPDGSQTFVSEDGAVTETTVNEDGSKVIDSSDGTTIQQSVSEEGVLTASYAAESPTEGEDSVDGEVSDAAPVPKGVQQDPSTGQTTVVLSSGEAVGHTLGEDGVLTMQSSAGTAEGTPDQEPIGDDGTGQQAEGGESSDMALDEGEIRLAVINPAVGEVITEGGVTVVESTFTESGGMKMVIAASDGGEGRVPEPEPEPEAELGPVDENSLAEPEGESASDGGEM
ncbi:MAG: hypothetical protein NZ600_06180, partial [Acidimicrobiales bacterium]|nr:hypothetical protein [Acidimicrobiales bacterium]